MSLFALADTHLSLGSDKPMDVFKGWDNYVEKIEKNWRRIISDTDDVVIPGDISWAMKLEETKTDFEFLNSLPGRKILIKGNHDFWWSTRNKIDNFLKLNNFNTITILFNDAVLCGNISVCGTRGWFNQSEKPEEDKKIMLREKQRLETSIDAGLKLGGEPVVFLHYPPFDGESFGGPVYETIVERKIKRCYFGHIHGDRTGRFDRVLSDGIQFSLVSCDHIGFCPVLIEKY